MRSFKHLDTLTALFVTVLLISNVASSKIVDFGFFTFDGGTLLFPLSYIFGDVLTEVYGYGRSRKVIWLGFAAALLMALTFIVVGALPPASYWDGQTAYEQILGLTPRIVVASLTAYFVGEFANAYLMAKLKVMTQGRQLWMRTIGSTLVGQVLDTAIFVIVAFAGIFSRTDLWIIIVSNYLFKCGVEICFTPITYWLTHWLKHQEHVDHYDVDTDFNPFNVSSQV